MCPPLKDLEETVEAFIIILSGRTQRRTDVFFDAMDATKETTSQLQEELDEPMPQAVGSDYWSSSQIHTIAIRCESRSRTLTFPIRLIVGLSSHAI